MRSKRKVIKLAKKHQFYVREYSKWSGYAGEFVYTVECGPINGGYWTEYSTINMNYAYMHMMSVLPRILALKSSETVYRPPEIEAKMRQAAEEIQNSSSVHDLADKLGARQPNA